MSRTQVSLTGGDGQDDTATDDDGRYDIRSTTAERDHVVIFYADTNITRQLSTVRCDEEVNMSVGLRTSTPAIM